MTLKDIIEQDIETVFLNVDEMAEAHTVDGKSVVCVFDQDASAVASSDVGGAAYLSTAKLMVRDGDLAKTPRVGKEMLIDSMPYLVLSVSDEMGMLAITLTVRDSL